MSARALQYLQALGSETADKRIELLRRISELGSISEAARQVGVSYKGAWQAIDTLTNLVGLPLLERNVGGSGGGGAQLTDAGQSLLRAAEHLAAAKAQVLAALQRSQTEPLQTSHLGALGLRTSMRNQLPCQVQSIRKLGQVARVLLALPDGSTLTSRITSESAELLSLTTGKQVLALCKATAVRVAASPSKPNTAGCNVLMGAVARASRAKTHAEIALRLPCGYQIVGFADDGAPSMRLRQDAVALMDESAVVIALT